MEHRATQGRLMKAEALRRFDAVVAAPFGAVGIRTEGVGTEDECVAEIAYLAPGIWQKRLTPQETAEGVYSVAFKPPRPGIYYVRLLQGGDMVPFHDGRQLTLEAVDK